ncbi:hypothetical protein SCARD494_05748 [Seiridium cardinale]
MSSQQNSDIPPSSSARPDSMTLGPDAPRMAGSGQSTRRASRLVSDAAPSSVPSLYTRPPVPEAQDKGESRGENLSLPPLRPMPSLPKHMTDSKSTEEPMIPRSRPDATQPGQDLPSHQEDAWPASPTWVGLNSGTPSRTTPRSRGLSRSNAVRRSSRGTGSRTRSRRDDRVDDLSEHLQRGKSSRPSTPKDDFPRQ